MRSGYFRPSTFPAVAADSESLQIRYCRVFCIFFMMFVHVRLRSTGLAEDETFRAIQSFLVDYLGRASVAALSVVSGYLLAKRCREKGCGSLARFTAKKSRTLLAPMLIWNMIFVAVLLLLSVGDPHPAQIIRDLRAGDGLSVLNSLTGIAGPPANLPLFFIRDLFVVQVVLFGALRLGRDYAFPVIAALMILSLSVELDPLIFREPILLFAGAGALLATAGRSLWDLSTSTPLRLAALLLTLSLMGPMGEAISTALGPDVFDIYKRAAIVAAVLAGSALLTGGLLDGWVRKLSAVTFLCYMMHVPVTRPLWSVWSRLFGDDWGFVSFFFLAPVLAFMAALALSRLLRSRERPAALLGVGNR